MEKLLLILMCITIVCSCGREASDKIDDKVVESSLLGDTIFETSNFNQQRRDLQLKGMKMGRVVSASHAFEQCVLRAGLVGWQDLGPYYYCKGDPFKKLSKEEQLKKALKVSRTFNNVRVDYEPGGTGNAHHHGGGGYGDRFEYFHWSSWFGRAARSVDYKICADSWFCKESPDSPHCSNFVRSDNSSKVTKCRYEAYPWPYSQVAGTIWHEVMHHHDYGHGPSNNGEAKKECGTRGIPDWHFQYNTMPYIVGACIGRVIKESFERCGKFAARRGGFSVIENLDSNRCVTVLDPKKMGVSLKPKHSKKCLDVTNASRSDNTNVRQYVCNDTGAQKWFLRAYQGSSQIFEIVNRTSGKCLDVDDFSRSNGANVQQYRCKQSKNQLWKVSKRKSGFYEIRALHSNKCLHIDGARQNNKANLVQYTCLNTTNQRFIIEGENASIDFGSDLGHKFFQEKSDQLVGLYGRSGRLIDQIGFLRKNRTRSKAYGGEGGSPFQLNCPKDYFLSGIHGNAGARVDSIGIICSKKSNGRVLNWKSQKVGGEGGKAFRHICPLGSKVVKFQGLSNEIAVNRLTVICEIKEDDSE